MKYQDTLAAYGLSEDTLSRPIKKRIKELNDFENESQKLTEKINSPTASADFKKQAKTTLEEVKIDMAELDAEIAKLIDRSVANKEVNQQRAALLREKKAAKKLGQQQNAPAANEPPPAPEPPPAAAVVEEPTPPVIPPTEPIIEAPPAAAAATEPVVDTPPPAAPAASEPPPAAPATEKKEGSLGWGWLIGGAVVLVGAFFGIRALNKNS